VVAVRQLGRVDGLARLVEAVAFGQHEGVGLKGVKLQRSGPNPTTSI
jgi:hypothetical protein